MDQLFFPSDLNALHPLAFALAALVILLFVCFDTDKDGYISVDEIKRACAVDRDGDGVISDAEKNAGVGGAVQAIASLVGVDEHQKFCLRDVMQACAAKVKQ